MFELLSQNERKALQILLVSLLVVLIFFFFVSLKEKRSYTQAVARFTTRQAEYERLNSQREEREKEWLKWKQAHEDIKDLRENYFYAEDDGYNRLRLSLEGIFDESGVQVSDIKYYYSQFEKEKLKKVNISFNLTGSYFSLKKFINAVENLQKFLLLEKIDFVDTPAEGGFLKLRITLAGYYAG
ncbi:MAG: type 4a pilus biogenesis protein PilO [Candidatus Aminicenantales bacterium]